MQQRDRQVGDAGTLMASDLALGVGRAICAARQRIDQARIECLGPDRGWRTACISATPMGLGRSCIARSWATSRFENGKNERLADAARALAASVWTSTRLPSRSLQEGRPGTSRPTSLSACLGCDMADQYPPLKVDTPELHNCQSPSTRCIGGGQRPGSTADTATVTAGPKGSDDHLRRGAYRGVACRSPRALTVSSPSPQPSWSTHQAPMLA